MSKDSAKAESGEVSRLEEALANISLEQYLAVICTAWRGAPPSENPDARECALVIGGNERLRRALVVFMASSLPDCSVHERANVDSAAAEGRPDPDIIVLQSDPQAGPKQIEASVRDVQAVWPGAIVVVLGGDADRASVSAALRHRARGYIPLNSQAGVAKQALQLIRAGGVYAPAAAFLSETTTEDEADSETEGDEHEDLEKEIMDNLRSHRVPALAADPAIRDVTLSPRQAQIIELVRRGLPNKIIAHEVGIQESTVKVHIRSIMRKLNASNRTAVAVYAAQMQAPGERD